MFLQQVKNCLNNYFLFEAFKYQTCHDPWIILLADYWGLPGPVWAGFIAPVPVELGSNSSSVFVREGRFALRRAWKELLGLLGGRARWPIEVPSNPYHSVILQDRPSPHADDCSSCGVQQHAPSAARGLERHAGSGTFLVPGALLWEQQAPDLVRWWEGALHRRRWMWTSGKQLCLWGFSDGLFSQARNCRWKSKMKGTNKISLSATIRVSVVNLLQSKGFIFPSFVSWLPVISGGGLLPRSPPGLVLASVLMKSTRRALRSHL